jgi:hypothetical protein
MYLFSLRPFPSTQGFRFHNSSVKNDKFSMIIIKLREIEIERERKRDTETGRIMKKKQ